MDAPIADTTQVPDLFHPENTNVMIAGGKVLPIGPPRLSAQSIIIQLESMLQAPYEGEDPKKLGMTKIQAGLKALSDRVANGDEEAIERVLNRMCGKPIQQVAAMSVTTTLKEYLDQIQAEEVIKYGPQQRPKADFGILSD